MTLGEQILKFRKQKGLSQEELANRLNVSRQSISLWETNQTVPQIDYLIELSRIFNVTLDELCGNDVKQENNDIVDQKETEEIDVPLATTHFEYDEDKIKKLIKILDKKRHTHFAIWLNCIIIGLLVLFVDDFETVLGVFLAVNILLFIYFKILNKKSMRILINEKRVIDIKFYNDYFISKLKTRNLDIETKLKYIDIDKLHIDDQLVVIVYSNNSKYVVFEQNMLIENKELILTQLKDQSKCCNQKTSTVNNNLKLKVISIILFIASFAALVPAEIIMALMSESSKYSFAQLTFVLNMWIFFIFAIIPASSLTFGIIFKNKVKCKKNIISGIIMTIILGLYGCFSIIFRPFFSFNENYLNDVAIETNLNFPSEFLIVTDTIKGSKETYVKFENENEVIEFEKEVMNLNIWDEISNLPSNLDLTILVTIQSYDYYYIHTIDKHEANNSFIDRNIEQIILAYDIENDVLVVYEIKAVNEN
ncbi:MAG: helix-turn-helix transcriptional regulator [Bacilli bacterium]|nr:helix-turn-helix transcriptional regulator [Bacilli bacterium]